MNDTKPNFLFLRRTCKCPSPSAANHCCPINVSIGQPIRPTLSREHLPLSYRLTFPVPRHLVETVIMAMNNHRSDEILLEHTCSALVDLSAWRLWICLLGTMKRTTRKPANEQHSLGMLGESRRSPMRSDSIRRSCLF